MASFDATTPYFGQRQNDMNQGSINGIAGPFGQPPNMTQTGIYAERPGTEIRPDSVSTPSIHHNNTPVSSTLDRNGSVSGINMGPRLSQQQQLHMLQQKMQFQPPPTPSSMAKNGIQTPHSVAANHPMNDQSFELQGAPIQGHEQKPKHKQKQMIKQDQDQDQDQDQGEDLSQDQNQEQKPQLKREYDQEQEQEHEHENELEQGLRRASMSGNGNGNGTGNANGIGNGIHTVDPNMQSQRELANVRNIRRSLGSAAIMRILDLVESISSAPHDIISSMAFWTRACEAFFRPSSIMRFTGPADMSNPMNGTGNGEAGESPESIFKDARSASNSYLLNMSSAPRFFLAQALAHNVVKHEIYLTGFRYQILSSGLIILVCRINLIFNYADGSSGTTSGMSHFLMTRDLFVQQLDCRFMRFSQSLSMNMVREQWTKFQNSQNSNNEFYQHMTQAAECTNLSRNTGLSDAAMRSLQIGDVMSCLQPLIAFTKASKTASPLQALDRFVEQGAKAFRRPSMASMVTPSPKTVAPEEPRAIKQRKLSSSLNSPSVPQEHRRV